MNESRLKSSLLASNSSTKPSLLLTSSLNSNSLLSSSPLTLKTTCVLTTNSLLHTKRDPKQDLNERKKKLDLSANVDLESKKLKILTEPKIDLLLTKPALNNVSTLLETKPSLLGNSKPAILHTIIPKPFSTLKSNLLQLSSKPIAMIDKKVTAKNDPILKRQHSNDRTELEVEDFDFTPSNLLFETVERELGRLADDDIMRVAKKLKISKPDHIGESQINRKFELISAKNGLINAVSSSLIREPNFKSSQDTTRQTILELAKRVAQHDPQFVLKLALYTRRELNIRVTANFLICLAAYLLECRPHLHRFFKQAVILPSDWIDIAEQYQLFTDKRINFGSLPSALRKCMVEKFPAFDHYQLAKYNKEKSRLAKNSNLRDVKHVKAKLNDDDEDTSSGKKIVEDKYIKMLKKGLSINDRILIEVVVKEECKSLKIDLISRDEKQMPQKGAPIRRGATSAAVTKGQKKENTDSIAVRINFNYERRRIVQKSLVNKKWSSRADVIDNPKDFDFSRSSLDSVFLFIDLKPSEFVFGIIKNDNERVLSKYGHFKHGIQLFKLNCIRVSGVSIKLKDLLVRSKEVVHMDSQANDETELRQRSYTLKQLIRQLHIAQPVDAVMSLIGKKYPSSFDDFVRLKLPGVYESERAGKRMKLPTPETWETQISLRGNKAAVWEQLIDNRKLPYMAMLRNLRNMIKCGISEKHHQWVIRKLQDEGAVIHSRQFPFRFFTAYSVLDELEVEFNEYIKWSQNNGYSVQLVRGKRPAKPTKSNFKDMNYDPEILKRYRTALDNALKVATTHNVSPIKGSTIILLNLGMNGNAGQMARGLGKRVTSVTEIGALLALMFKYSCENSKLIVYLKGLVYDNFQLDESTILDNMRSLIELKNMQVSSSEPANYPKRVLEEILDRKELFDNMVILSDQIGDVAYQQQFLRKYRAMVNETLLFVNVSLAGDSCQIVKNEHFDHENDICIAGFSDAILRFVAERGNQGQLVHIENIEKAYDIEALKFNDKKSLDNEVLSSFEAKVSLIERPKFKQFVPSTEWRTLKVFISSTFRDMHSERDLLAKNIFPLLRSKLTKYSINIYDIDLRWGITEANANQTLDLCLNQVLNSDYFLGILGERYGQVVSDYTVRKNPALDWLLSYSPQASITELEIETKLRREDETPEQKMRNTFFYFRDHSFIRDVPSDLRNHFEEETSEGRIKLDRLKRRIKGTKYEVFDGYRCKWLKLDASNRAFLAGLESFCVRVFNNLFNSIIKDYKDKVSLVELDEIVHLNGLSDIYIKCAAEGFVGRETALKRFEKILDDTKHVPAYTWSNEAARALAKEKNSTVHMILIVGEAGCGKTAFLSHFLMNQSNLDECFVHCVGSYPNSEYVTMFLKRFSITLNRKFTLGIDEASTIESNSNDFQKKTFSNVLAKLDEFLVERKFYVIVDGVDQLVDDLGVVDNSFAWLPERISPKIVFLFTARLSSPTRSILGKIASSNKSTNLINLTSFELEAFDILDKSAFVRAQLAKFNKYLDENPFNNQMKLLTGKRESSDPLYLTLACEELRLHGHYETLSAKIKELPIKVNKLVEFVIDRLKNDFGEEFLNSAFMFVCCSRDGLLENELKILLSLYFNIKKANLDDELEKCESFLTLDKNRFLQKALFASKSVSTEKFLSFIESISQTFLKTRIEGESSIIAIKKNVLIENTLRTRFGHIEHTSIKLIHRIMAFYYWSLIDTEFKRYWNLTGSSRAFTYLPYHLVMADLRNDALTILSDIIFLHAKCEKGLVADLVDDFDLHENWRSKSIFNEQNIFAKKQTGLKTKNIIINQPSSTLSNDFQAYKLFVMSNFHILVTNSRLLFQQALNQPNDSVVVKDVHQALVSRADIRGCNIIEWMNKSVELSAFNMVPTRLTDFDDSVSCAIISPDSSLVACGTENCEIKLFALTTTKFLRKLHGHAGRINALVFLDSKTLCSASSDGLACVWNVDEGFRIKVLNKHNDHVVNDCCADRKSLVTVGWDCTAKIWNPFEGTILGELKHPRPVNCITFNPDGSQVATGCWDACIRIFNYFDRARKAVLRGHKTSVRSITFSNNGVYIGSSSIDGEVKLWNSRNAAQVATLKGHSLPVNSVCFSPRNQFLITGSSDRTVKIWPGSVGKMIRRIDGSEKHSDQVTSVCFEQQTGHLFAVGTHSGEVRLYEVYGGFVKAKHQPHQAAIRRLKFVNSDSNYILTGSEDGQVKLLYISDTTITVVAEMSPYNSPMAVTALDVNKQNLILAGSEDCSMYLYIGAIESHKEDNTGHKNIKIAPVICLNAHKSPLTACSFNADGDKFATASKNALVIVWEYTFCNESVKELFRIDKAHDDWITDLSWSPSADFILTASNDLTLKIWSGSNGTEKSKLVGHTATINSCSFRYGCVVSASLDGTIKVWSHRGHEITTLYGHQAKVNSIDLFVKKRKKFTLEFEKTEDESEEMKLGSLWGEQVELEALKEKKKAVESGRNAIEIEEVYLVSGSDDSSIRIWKPIESCYLASLNNHNDRVNSVSLNRDDLVASSSNDRTVSLTHLKDFFAKYESILNVEQVIRGHLSEITSLALNEKKDILISGSLDGMVYLWKISSNSNGLDFLVDFKAHDQFVGSICVIQDNQNILRFVTCCKEEPLKVWAMRKNQKDMRPTIELVSMISRKSREKNMFLGKFEKDGQTYLTTVDYNNGQIWIKFYSNLDANIKQTSGGCLLINETSLISTLRLSEDILFITLVQDEIIEIKLAECMKKKCHHN